MADISPSKKASADDSTENTKFVEETGFPDIGTTSSFPAKPVVLKNNHYLATAVDSSSSVRVLSDSNYYYSLPCFKQTLKPSKPSLPLVALVLGTLVPACVQTISMMMERQKLDRSSKLTKPIKSEMGLSRLVYQPTC